MEAEVNYLLIISTFSSYNPMQKQSTNKGTLRVSYSLAGAGVKSLNYLGLTYPRRQLFGKSRLLKKGILFRRFSFSFNYFGK